MFYENGTFKDFSDLNDEENQLAYKLAKWAILDAFNNGLLKGEFLKRNIGNFLKDGNFSQEDIQEIQNTFFQETQGMTFGKDRKTLGFKTRHQ
ncbi:hypothetical protein H6776_00545 [Candidatus Nomurabacteria bacterium]|nr:hypothetical protein [Candidatus Nomurabacteria bacterium]